MEKILYGYCVVVESTTIINNNVSKHIIVNEFASYWGIPRVAYSLN